MPTPMKKVELICDWCGQPFTCKESIAAKGRRFCTAKCFAAYRRSKHMTTYCENCGKEIDTYKNEGNRKRYCTISCAMSARNRTDQNPSYHRDVSGEKNPMYGKGRSGKDNPMYGRKASAHPLWKGKPKKHPAGYIMVYAPLDHPIHATGSGPYILEHRLVMEQHLGRYLEPEETVHHIDGDPTNNAIENLCLYSSKSEHMLEGHPGGRWAKLRQQEKQE